MFNVQKHQSFFRAVFLGVSVPGSLLLRLQYVAYFCVVVSTPYFSTPLLADTASTVFDVRAVVCQTSQYCARDPSLTILPGCCQAASNVEPRYACTVTGCQLAALL